MIAFTDNLFRRYPVSPMRTNRSAEHRSRNLFRHSIEPQRTRAEPEGRVGLLCAPACDEHSLVEHPVATAAMTRACAIVEFCVVDKTLSNSAFHKHDTPATRGSKTIGTNFGPA
ncbi:hypothetical protein KXR83_03910 [Williamsia muralis]|uniref:hypothetical protein n=1 Tax=Williamsia marianensis TaxID=85044 RepID=UPI003F15E0F5